MNGIFSLQPGNVFFLRFILIALVILYQSDIVCFQRSGPTTPISILIVAVPLPVALQKHPRRYYHKQEHLDHRSEVLKQNIMCGHLHKSPKLHSFTGCKSYRRIFFASCDYYYYLITRCVQNVIKKLISWLY